MAALLAAGADPTRLNQEGAAPADGIRFRPPGQQPGAVPRQDIVGAVAGHLAAFGARLDSAWDAEGAVARVRDAVRASVEAVSMPDEATAADARPALERLSGVMEALAAEERGFASTVSSALFLDRWPRLVDVDEAVLAGMVQGMARRAALARAAESCATEALADASVRTWAAIVHMLSVEPRSRAADKALYAAAVCVAGRERVAGTLAAARRERQRADAAMRQISRAATSFVGEGGA